jgi:hypothetical protein
MINRYYNRTPYQGELYQPNVELISEVLGQAQKKYDTNFATAQQLKNKYINALPQDRAIADEIQASTEKRIDDIVTKYSGDYSAASKDLYSLIGDLEKDYNPGGKAHAIETNYKGYNEAIGREQERLKKGEVISAQVAALQGHIARTYSGIGEKDKVTGSYNMLTVPDLAKYVDESKLIEEAYKSTPEQKRKEGKTYFKDGNQYYQEVETQGKPYEVLRQSFSDALFGDNAYTSYKDQLGYLSGDNPTQQQFEDDIINTADRYASTRAYMNTSDILKAERDPVYLENLRHGHRMNEAKYKQKLKDASTQEVMGNLFGALGVGEAVNRAAGSELPKDWRTYSTGKQELKFPGTMSGAMYIESETLSTRGNLYDLISSNKIKEVAPGINANLLTAGARKLAAEQGFNLDNQSEAWKRNFYASNESEIRDQYNNDRKNVQVGIADEFAVPDGAGKVLKEQLIPRAMAGNTSVFQIKNGSLQEYTKLGDIGISENDIYDDNGSIKKGVKVTDYVVPGQFYTKPAYKVVTPGGKEFFITDQNKDRYEYFTGMSNAHAPIWEEGKEWGTSFPARIGESTIRIAPKMTYQYDAQGTAHQDLQYYHVTPDGKMELITNAKGDGAATIYDMWNLEGDRIKSSMPLGAALTKKFIFDTVVDDNEE